jgi:hypothetical protein
MLLKHVFEEADREGVPVFLQTTLDGSAKGLYEKLGFKETERYFIDLGKFGGEVDEWDDVAMIREVKK